MSTRKRRSDWGGTHRYPARRAKRKVPPNAKRCRARTADGHRCRCYRQDGYQTCAFHRADAQRWRNMGGRVRARQSAQHSVVFGMLSAIVRRRAPLFLWDVDQARERTRTEWRRYQRRRELIRWHKRDAYHAQKRAERGRGGA